MELEECIVNCRAIIQNRLWRRDNDDKLRFEELSDEDLVRDVILVSAPLMGKCVISLAIKPSKYG
jgi:hypothetical protein